MSDLDEILNTINLSFATLKTHEGTTRFDDLFIQFLPKDEQQTLLNWRQGLLNFSQSEESEFQIKLGIHLNRFIAQHFAITEQIQHLTARAEAYKAIMLFKDRFIQRGARRYRQPIDGTFKIHTDALLKILNLPDISHFETKLASYANALEVGSAEELTVIQWATLAMNEEEGQNVTTDWVSFKLPERVDPTQLVPSQDVSFKGIPVKVGTKPLRRRDGFSLTDRRMDAKQVASEINYCKYCHDHDGDFCSKGFPVRKSEPHLGLKKDSFGNTQTGCPLEEKISEMITLEKEGLSIGALAMIMIENPMVPATGHRICNDCMKACIYQKQDPVNIPQIETQALTNVLNLPWGVEIYELLTRWNPLKRTDFLPSPLNNRKVLVAGLGPAGFTMAHYLSHKGCHVVGVDGLKLEPLDPKLVTQPIRDWKTLEENLDERILTGFGGVAEYGITVRWDKNFLKLIYLTLSRRSNIQFFGGIRLGGTLMLEDAFNLGFDHVTMAVGAGLPRVLNIENSLARGMRQASDFLMAMQLTGAAKNTSLASLQVRLPAVVIGGGLTAVDTATEIQAYYIKQVEKVLHRVETLGEESVRKSLFTPEDEEILSEFLAHGREVRKERERAKAANEAPNFVPLIHAWGGVLLAYRRTMQESPAYTLNHEEIIKAFEEGIFYGERLNPLGVNLDKYGHIESINFSQYDGNTITMPARAVMIAAGTSPNTIYATEHGNIDIEEDNHFQGYDLNGQKVQHDWNKHVKEDFAPFTSFNMEGHRVSYIGDTHPTFNGNVVKAITSAKRTADQVMAAIEKLPQNTIDTVLLKNQLEHDLVATIESINTDNPSVAEVWIKAPFVAKNFKPGQFFRLQTYEVDGQIVENTRLQIPVFTASGTGSNNDSIRLMVFQWGVAPRLLSRLKKGDRLVLAGPTGAPTHIPKNKTILVIAGRWGAAVMLDIGHALREAGNKVIYIGTFGSANDVDKMDELEAGADQIVWCVQKGETIPARRPQDISLVESDMIHLLQKLHQEGSINMLDVDWLLAMGSTGLLKGLQKELSENGALVSQFKSDLEVTGMVGSPMQCMMKGVCGQCLQWQIDPITKKRTKVVFSCAEQDQPLKSIDLDNLTARTSQNRLLDSINAQWLSYIFTKL